MSKSANHNKIKKAISIFHGLYPGKFCTVEFAMGVYKRTKANSKTLWPDNCGDPKVVIDIRLPWDKAEDALSHELAHVATGHRGHGDAWDKAFGRIKQGFKEERL